MIDQKYKKMRILRRCFGIFQELLNFVLLWLAVNVYKTA